MKTALTIRICLICLAVASAAFLTLKATVWKGETDSNFKDFKKNIRQQYYNPKSNDPGKSDVKVERIVKTYSGVEKKYYEAVPVETTRVKRSDIEVFLVNNCTLEPEKQVDVVSKTSGIVLNILVEEGNYVESGDHLAKLDDEESLLALKEAKVRKENAERIYKRSLENFKDDIISKEEFEDKKFQFEIALAELEKKQLEYRYTTIKSPIDGVVVERNIEEGYNVEKDQMVFKVADFDPILGRIYIPERDINKIEEGLIARIVSEFLPEVEFEGKVKMLSPVVDPESGTVKATIEISNLMGGVLRPGMFVSVYTIVGQHQDALLIPKKALILEAETDEVFVVKDFIIMDVNPDGIESLSIGNNVICELKKSDEGNVFGVDDSSLNGKIVDISKNHNDKLPCKIIVEADDVISDKTNKVFDTVSFYDSQNVLVSQIKDVNFDVETKAFKTKITLGFKEGNNVEVLTGLKEGDRVITVGQDDVGHGANVIIVNEDVIDNDVNIRNITEKIKYQGSES
ncbi:MAG: RND multidrug efflux membrane fusion protein MexC precursor [Candidatus Scalindua rubra]|uniref:RND multidrug efflux membrane fusion protein MexC n=1 Tax=Candidatus Scalindua rubra TaxID=1872076 RepID=A0A1E3X9S1_9BACT|nr:MAG: RND multidrug efflux membrane fusion protein MexC precursor [Candidatus Scalindua rubra]